MSDDLATADQLLFDALAPEIREAIGRVIVAQVNAGADAWWIAGFVSAKNGERNAIRGRAVPAELFVLTTGHNPHRPPAS